MATTEIGSGHVPENNFLEINAVDTTPLPEI